VPFTFAHPAAVLPVARLTGKLTLTSALVVGSIVPDLWYVLPGFDRGDSHTWTGILHFGLPVGLGVWLFWRLLLQGALHDLYPPALRSHLPAHATWRWSDVLTVPFSLAFGAWTHLRWDVFTHDGHMEFLGSNMSPHLLGRSHSWDTVLQYTSSVAGISLVAAWLGISAFMNTRGEPWKERLWPGRWRAGLWLLLALFPAGIGAVLTGIFLNRHAQETFSTKGLVNGSARHMLAALVVELLIYGSAHRLFIGNRARVRES